MSASIKLTELVWPNIAKLVDEDGKIYTIKPGERIVFPKQNGICSCGHGRIEHSWFAGSRTGVCLDKDCRCLKYMERRVVFKAQKRGGGE